MYIKFGWGKSPTSDQMKYEVSDFSFNVFTDGGDTKRLNCKPGVIRMSIRSALVKDPGSEFLDFAKKQQEVEERGAGKISVYAGEEVGEALQEVSFSHGWITGFAMNASQTDEEFRYNVEIAAGNVTVSGISFSDSQRLKQ
ncbi:MAG: hypothetical protein JXM70_08780 [Pirellulales bacterium]|nr:hypothetical protein [Pirellulales bacterium]